MNAARQSPSTWLAAVIGVLMYRDAGQSARRSRDPAKPPILVWTSHIPDGLAGEESRFHS